VMVAVQGLRLEGALDDAAGDELRDGVDTAIEQIGERRQPDRERPGVAAAEPMLRGAAHVNDGLAIEIRGRPGADRQDTAGAELAGRGERRREPLRPQLAEGRERGELAAGSSIELSERP